MKWFDFINRHKSEAKHIYCALSSKEYEESNYSVERRKTHNKGIMSVYENMTEEEEEQFIESLNNIVPKDVSSLKDPRIVGEIFTKLINGAQEVMKFRELQETKRHEITANSNIAIRKIEATHALLSEYLERTFDERRMIFNQQFKVIDKALETGDNNMLAIGLNSVQQLVETSPFKALTDFAKTQKMLSNPDYEFDI